MKYLLRKYEWRDTRTPRPNKFRKRKRFASKPFKFASFVSPLPKKFALQYFSGSPELFRSIRRDEHCSSERNSHGFRKMRCLPGFFHTLCVNKNSCGVLSLFNEEIERRNEELWWRNKFRILNNLAFSIYNLAFRILYTASLYYRYYWSKNGYSLD